VAAPSLSLYLQHLKRRRPRRIEKHPPRRSRTQDKGTLQGCIFRRSSLLDLRLG
jgi:hypothetical protein